MADQTALRIEGARVTSNFFDVLGVRPLLGRGFAAGEDRPGANRVVVLSHRLWLSQFHGDPNALGRQVAVNDVPRIIVGIMPMDFAYPAPSGSPVAARRPRPATPSWWRRSR